MATCDVCYRTETPDWVKRPFTVSPDPTNRSYVYEPSYTTEADAGAEEEKCLPCALGPIAEGPITRFIKELKSKGWKFQSFHGKAFSICADCAVKK